ncbi:hypothetical protein V8C42DRAFT_140306 [Trichoderma barbatum]
MAPGDGSSDNPIVTIETLQELDDAAELQRQPNDVITDESTSDEGTDVLEIFHVEIDNRVMNMAQLMLEMQQFEILGARPRTPTPPPSITIATAVNTTREEAMEKVGELINTIRSTKWDPELNAKLNQTLTEHFVMVLPAEIKSFLTMFACWTEADQLTGWLARATEDKDQHHWIKVESVPAPPMWSTNPADTVLDDLAYLAETQSIKPVVKRKIRVSVDQLRHYVRWTEAKFKSITESVDGKVREALNTNGKRQRTETGYSTNVRPIMVDRGTQTDDLLQS